MQAAGITVVHVDGNQQAAGLSVGPLRGSPTPGGVHPPIYSKGPLLHDDPSLDHCAEIPGGKLPIQHGKPLLHQVCFDEANPASIAASPPVSLQRIERRPVSHSSRDWRRAPLRSVVFVATEVLRPWKCREAHVGIKNHEVIIICKLLHILRVIDPLREAPRRHAVEHPHVRLAQLEKTLQARTVTIFRRVGNDDIDGPGEIVRRERADRGRN
mmetsp:Transcript_21144/g.49201  ORF Transcript_21144/g.49201 Transcript_21144/m.49201 type:complete len:213 (+) Transcript_21144:489-1127(+)